MHVVTYNRNYGSLRNALSHSDGLAVLGVFFQVGFATATVLFMCPCSKVSYVSPLSGISGLSFDSTLLSSLVL